MRRIFAFAAIISALSLSACNSNQAVTTTEVVVEDPITATEAAEEVSDEASVSYGPVVFEPREKKPLSFEQLQKLELQGPSVPREPFKTKRPILLTVADANLVEEECQIPSGSTVSARLEQSIFLAVFVTFTPGKFNTDMQVPVCQHESGTMSPEGWTQALLAASSEQSG